MPQIALLAMLQAFAAAGLSPYAFDTLNEVVKPGCHTIGDRLRRSRVH
jgi:hypothetical protein